MKHGVTKLPCLQDIKYLRSNSLINMCSNSLQSTQWDIRNNETFAFSTKWGKHSVRTKFTQDYYACGILTSSKGYESLNLFFLFKIFYGHCQTSRKTASSFSSLEMRADFIKYLRSCVFERPWQEGLRMQAYYSVKCRTQGLLPSPSLSSPYAADLTSINNIKTFISREKTCLSSKFCHLSNSRGWFN